MLQQVLDRLNGVKKTREGYKARCPAHDDSDPSLVVREGDNQPVVFHCFAGCSPKDVVAALGFTWAEVCEDGGDLSGEVKRKEKKAPRPRLPEYSEAEWKERYRAWMAMNKDEVRLYSGYRRRRARAWIERDREAFDRWQGKMDRLLYHVLHREMRGHRETQHAEANTHHSE